jgi:3-deoxy-D-arabino-heptulosonate 7-phosphate (DAHP) synthase
MNDTDVLCDALEEVGVKEVQKHDTAVPLEGYHGDKRKDTAEIVIPRRAIGAMSNDIGFKRGEDGNYKAIISAFDSGRYNAKWMSKLKLVYAEKKIFKQAKTAGLQFTGKVIAPNGNTKLNFVKA